MDSLKEVWLITLSISMIATMCNKRSASNQSGLIRIVDTHTCVCERDPSGLNLFQKQTGLLFIHCTKVSGDKGVQGVYSPLLAF